jgi:hypothetical protein
MHSTILDNTLTKTHPQFLPDCTMLYFGKVTVTGLNQSEFSFYDDGSIDEFIVHDSTDLRVTKTQSHIQAERPFDTSALQPQQTNDEIIDSWNVVVEMKIHNDERDEFKSMRTAFRYIGKLHQSGNLIALDKFLGIFLKKEFSFQLCISILMLTHDLKTQLTNWNELVQYTRDAGERREHRSLSVVNSAIRQFA